MVDQQKFVGHTKQWMAKTQMEEEKDSLSTVAGNIQNLQG